MIRKVLKLNWLLQNAKQKMSEEDGLGGGGGGSWPGQAENPSYAQALLDIRRILITLRSHFSAP